MKRTVLILEGVDRGKFGTVDRIDRREGTCRVTVGNDSYGINLALVSFEDEPTRTGAEFSGFSPDESRELSEFDSTNRG